MCVLQLCQHTLFGVLCTLLFYSVEKYSNVPWTGYHNNPHNNIPAKLPICVTLKFHTKSVIVHLSAVIVHLSKCMCPLLETQ